MAGPPFPPGIGQGKRILDLWNRFEGLPKFEEAVDDLLEELEEETGIDFEEDVLPWVGPDLSLGLMNVTEDSGDVTALIGVKDHIAASGFLQKLVENMREDGVEFRREDDIHGFEVWADWDSDTGLALSGDWFLFASTEDALNDVLDLISGEEGQSLSDKPNFQEARSAMTGDRAMSLYMDLERAAELSGLGADVLSEATGMGLDAVGPALTSCADGGWWPAARWGVDGARGGVPRSIVYDNTTLAVAKTMGYGRRKRTRVFSELVSHYLFEDRYVALTSF